MGIAGDRSSANPDGLPGGNLSLDATDVRLVSGALASNGVDQADRAISKAQLHALLHFHMPPINVVVYHGSRRDLVLRGVSRLDAFSGYPFRT